jgi:hypothetical protein
VIAPDSGFVFVTREESVQSPLLGMKRDKEQEINTGDGNTQQWNDDNNDDDDDDEETQEREQG